MKNLREYARHSEQEGTERSQQIYRNAAAVIPNGIFSEMFFHFSMVIVNLLYKIERERQIGRWDLIIAHPPCTYISNAGARWLYKGGQLNIERYIEGMKGAMFLMKMLAADCDRVAVENPIPSKIYDLPQCTQIIQPYEYGEPFSKKTCLWIRGMKPLQPTNILTEYKPYCSSGSYSGSHDPKFKGVSRAGGSAKIRSKTFKGIAEAMAEQWG